MSEFATSSAAANLIHVGSDLLVEPRLDRRSVWITDVDHEVEIIVPRKDIMPLAQALLELERQYVAIEHEATE